jgi:hypothetical protein
MWCVSEWWLRCSPNPVTQSFAADSLPESIHCLSELILSLSFTRHLIHSLNSSLFSEISLLCTPSAASTLISRQTNQTPTSCVQCLTHIPLKTNESPAFLNGMLSPRCSHLFFCSFPLTGRQRNSGSSPALGGYQTSQETVPLFSAVSQFWLLVSRLTRKWQNENANA